MKKIAFFSEKGGVGKSALTVITASQLSYREERKVAVIDCDFAQFSVIKMRKRELATLISAYPEAEKRVNEFYPIYPCSNPSEARRVTAMEEKKGVDFIIYDFTGTLDNETTASLIQEMDYIFLPINKDFKVVVAAVDTMSFLESIRYKGQLVLFFSKIPYQRPPAYIDVIKGIAKDAKKKGFTIIRDLLYNYEGEYSSEFLRAPDDPAKLGKKVFQSTLFPPNGASCTKTNYAAFFDSFFQVITGQPLEYPEDETWGDEIKQN